MGSHTETRHNFYRYSVKTVFAVNTEEVTEICWHIKQFSLAYIPCTTIIKIQRQLVSRMRMKCENHRLTNGATAFRFGYTLKQTTLSNILCEADHVLYNRVKILSTVYMAYCHLRRICQLFSERLIILNCQIATKKCSETRLLIVYILKMLINK